MVATRSDLAVEAVPEEASDEERRGRLRQGSRAAGGARLVRAWANADGNPIDPSAEAIDALLDVWPIFEPSS